MTTVDRLVDNYLDQLEQELHDVPRARRRELVDEIAQHIAEGRAEAVSEAEVRTLLDRLGEPAEIADEARERFGVRPTPAGTPWHEIVALLLLLPGSFVPFGWLAGVVMLWLSKRWTVGDKMIGTFVPPGGLGVFLLLVLYGDAITAWTLALVLLPIVTVFYLAWRLRKYDPLAGRSGVAAREGGL
jgi:hypothetical protein